MPTQELQQRQILSQQQLQALNILSLDGAALDEMLKKEEIDNPLFDLDKIHGTVERPISVQTPDKEGDLSERAAPDKTAQDLYLESQLPANATKAERGVFRHMVEFLEPGTGLLPETVEEVAEILAAPLYVVERCLSWLHQMEPAGVGAATTSESLVLQAFHKGMTDPTLLGILFDHLEDVAAKRYRTIMRAYGLTMEEVQHYVSLIRTLEPYPSSIAKTASGACACRTAGAAACPTAATTTCPARTQRRSCAPICRSSTATRTISCSVWRSAAAPCSSLVS